MSSMVFVTLYDVVVYFHVFYNLYFWPITNQQLQDILYISRCRTRIMEQEDPKDREHCFVKFIKIMRVSMLCMWICILFVQDLILFIYDVHNTAVSVLIFYRNKIHSQTEIENINISFKV